MLQSLTPLSCVIAECQDWCDTHPQPWSEKCTWANTCDGCSKCGSCSVLRGFVMQKFVRSFFSRINTVVEVTNTVITFPRHLLQNHLHRVARICLPKNSWTQHTCSSDNNHDYVHHNVDHHVNQHVNHNRSLNAFLMQNSTVWRAFVLIHLPILLPSSLWTRDALSKPPSRFYIHDHYYHCRAYAEQQCPPCSFGKRCGPEYDRAVCASPLAGYCSSQGWCGGGSEWMDTTKLAYWYSSLPSGCCERRKL